LNKKRVISRRETLTSASKKAPYKASNRQSSLPETILLLRPESAISLAISFQNLSLDDDVLVKGDLTKSAYIIAEFP
jgi:hypothetical protein